jgi:hypothetical protein
LQGHVHVSKLNIVKFCHLTLVAHSTGGA